MKTILALTLLLSLPTTLHAEEKGLTKEKINIEADKLHVSQTYKVANFTGNVKISQGRITIGADHIKAHFDGDENDFRSIVAEGNVTILYDETTASGKKAIYNPTSSVITLTGDVVLLQGQNALKGSALSYNLETGDINLKGTESGRVKGSFTLGE
ncbi:MAG: lipopolysaccharide transport periplasmic protein LptA [Pseudomonadota bacterium]|nr:lipopolysaccharide transport periplasmic protein LptA [Pseudomonadota bacterium]